MRKGQSWSMDVVVAVVIFGFVSIVFTSFALFDRTDINKLQTNAQVVAGELEDSVTGCQSPLVEDNKVNRTSVECLYAQPYNNIKQDFNIKGEFCIYFEDEFGQLIIINDSGGNNFTGFGSSELVVGGHRCGVPI